MTAPVVHSGHLSGDALSRPWNGPKLTLVGSCGAVSAAAPVLGMTETARCPAIASVVPGSSFRLRLYSDAVNVHSRPVGRARPLVGGIRIGAFSSCSPAAPMVHYPRQPKLRPRLLCHVHTNASVRMRPPAKVRGRYFRLTPTPPSCIMSSGMYNED